MHPSYRMRDRRGLLSALLQMLVRCHLLYRLRHKSFLQVLYMFHHLGRLELHHVPLVLHNQMYLVEVGAGVVEPWAPRLVLRLKSRLLRSI